MSDTDLQIALMEAGRMNLMHLPPGAIAWLWDRPKKQIDATESLAVAANAYGNPVVDASLLKADQNILLIKCEGGECFRVYPDGGYSYDDTPMDIGGCSSVLQGAGDCGCEYDDIGHTMDTSPDDGYNDAMDVVEPEPMIGADLMADIGNDEHMDYADPEAGEPSPHNLSNLAGEPTMDENYGDQISKIIQDACGEVEEGVGEVDGPGVGDGMGTGSPYVGDMGYASEQLDNMFMSRELGEFRIRDLPPNEVDMLAESLGLSEVWGDDEYYDRYEHDDVPSAPPEQVYVEVYDDATDDYKEVAINVHWDIQPTEYEGPYVFAQGGAVLDDMQLASPVQVNGKVYNRINNELAALIMATVLEDEVEATPKAYEALRLHIEDKEGADIDVPTNRYPDSRSY